jgi:hypothetical protein
MTLLPYWIQRADFSSADFEPVDIHGAVRAFATHDWGAELDFLSELDTKGCPSCPPGIGFVTATGAILHVCPSSEGCALVPYHAETKSKVFGFIPISRFAVHTREGVQQSEVAEVIHAFFEGWHEWLLRKLAAA